MKLTPLDIKRHKFEKGFRGYDPEDVDSYLKRVADQLEALQEEIRLAHERTRETESKLQHYERVELALQEALESAKVSAKRSAEDAERRAAVIVEEAELRAQQILQDVERERFGMKQDLVKLSARQAEVAARLKGFLVSELEILSDFQGDDTRGLVQSGPTALLSDGSSLADIGLGDDSVPDPPREAVASDAASERQADAAGAEDADPESSDEPAELSPPMWSAQAGLSVPQPEPFVAVEEDEPEGATDASYSPPPPVESPVLPSPSPADETSTGRVQVSSKAEEDPLYADESEVLGPATPVAEPAEEPPPAWTAPLGGNVAGSEAERERIRRILEDLD